MENQDAPAEEPMLAGETTVKKIEKGDMTKAPPWCNFMRDHLVAVNGWWYTCVGYTPQFEVVLKVHSPTSETKKRFRAAGLPFPKLP